MKKSIFKNSIFNMSYKLLNVLFPMITAMYIARVLLPEGVGKVGYAQNILSYFTVIASMGIPTYGAREIARVVLDRKKTDTLFSELFILNFASTLICSIVYLALIAFLPTFNNQQVLFLSVGIQLFLNIFNVDWFYSGKEEYVYITVRSTVIKVVSIICIFLFVKNINDLVLYAFINALAVSGNYLFNVFNLRHRVSLRLKNLNLVKHLKSVTILLLTTLATNLYNQIGVTMMGSISSEEQIGYYTYAIKLIAIVTSISTAIAITTLPRMSQLHAAKKTNDFQELFSKTISVILVIVVPCITGILCVADNAVRFVYGESFLASASILKIASPIILIIAISYAYGSIVLTAVNKEKYLLFATFAGMTVNIALNAILIPRFAGIGAALASVCAEFVVLSVHIYFAKSYIKLNLTLRDKVSLLVSNIGLIVIVLCFEHILVFSHAIALIGSVLAGIITYGLILILMKNTVAIWIARRIGVNKIGPVQKILKL
ncbi:flippase [Neobacillus drentensis]|uniref:flippase n=1 Tax=Neobacillus drentensis TaxID=220684 RepID=UPI003000D9A6